MLQAIANGRLLTVSGGASVSDGYTRIKIEYLPNGITVTDTDQAQTTVPIQGDPTEVLHLDLQGLTGAGAYVFWAAPNDNKITGSAQGDYVYLYGDSNDTLVGGKGDDYLFGNEGRDLLRGDLGSDRLNGGAGNDRITGGGGDEMIDGGAGADTLVYSGVRADYDISLVNGRYVITHAGGAGRDGTDTVANIEFLKFSDQTVSIDTTPTNIQAVASGQLLSVSGAASVSNSSTRIEVEYLTDGITVTDNDQVQTDIPISGEPSGILHLDLRGLTGAGGYVFWAAPYDNRISGSAQGDYIYLYGLSNDTLLGGKGDDFLFGNEGKDLLRGDLGADDLDGGAGNDRIFGGGGDDTIDGGDGRDTLGFVGARADYEIAMVDDHYVISHRGGAGRDGIDTFSNVELLKFSDQTVVVDDIFV